MISCDLFTQGYRTGNHMIAPVSVTEFWKIWVKMFSTLPQQDMAKYKPCNPVHKVQWSLIIKQSNKHILTTRQIWGIWKLRPAYSQETPNLGKNRWCFVPCDLEIWWMTLENNRASSFCCFKLCATFHSHWWIQTGVIVRKRPIWVKFDDF